MGIPYFQLDVEDIIHLHADGFDIICDGDTMTLTGIKQS